MAARAMGNFGLTRLRIVNPRDGWPNVHAVRAASGADHILDHAELFDTVEQAVAGCTFLLATTARAPRPGQAGGGAGGSCPGDLGRDRRRRHRRHPVRPRALWPQNEEVALADRIVTYPVNPGFASLNLAQAVLLMGYEWFKLSTSGALPFAMPERSERASQHQMQAFFDNLVRELDKVEFLRPAEKRETMLVNLRNIFTRMEPTKQDMPHLTRRGDGDRGRPQGSRQGRRARRRTGHAAAGAAGRARAGRVAVGKRHGARHRPAVRRNPTDAERIMWQAADHRPPLRRPFKRQTPVGGIFRISSRSCIGWRSS